MTIGEVITASYLIAESEGLIKKPDFTEPDVDANIAKARAMGVLEE